MLRNGITSRTEVLNRNLLELSGVGPAIAEIITQAAQTYSDEEWASTFPRLAGIPPKPPPIRWQARLRWLDQHEREQVVLQMRLSRALLTDDERLILDLHYGLADGHRYTFQEIARLIGRSRGRAEQLCAVVRRKLLALAELRTQGAPLLEEATNDLERYQVVLDQAGRKLANAHNNKSQAAQAEKREKREKRQRFCRWCGQPIAEPKRLKYCSTDCTRQAGNQWHREHQRASRRVTKAGD